MVSRTPSRQRVDAFVAFLRAHADGRARAVTARRLASQGFTDRELRALVNAATEQGVLVCADGAGYFLPRTAEEATPGLQRLESQVRQMRARHARQCRLVAREFGGPEVALPLFAAVADEQEECVRHA